MNSSLAISIFSKILFIRQSQDKFHEDVGHIKGKYQIRPVKHQAVPAKEAELAKKLKIAILKIYSRKEKIITPLHQYSQLVSL